MGAQFQVDVNVVTHGAEKVNELEQKLSKMQNKSVDIKVNVDGLDKLDTSKLNKQFNVASRELSKNSVLLILRNSFEVFYERRN